MEAVWLFLVFFRASLLSVGGQNSLPLVREALAPSGFITDGQLIDALTVGRVSSGPNGIYSVSVGFLVLGWLGAAAALAAMILPPLLVIPLGRPIRGRQPGGRIDGVVRGIALTTSGLTIATSILLLASMTGATLSPWQLALVAAGAVVGASGRLHPLAILVPAGVVGFLLGGS